MLSKEDMETEREELRPYLSNLVQLVQKTNMLFNGDAEEVEKWILEPNSYFFDKAPIEVIFVEPDSVLDFLDERLGLI